MTLDVVISLLLLLLFLARILNPPGYLDPKQRSITREEVMVDFDYKYFLRIFPQREDLHSTHNEYPGICVPSSSFHMSR